MFICDGMLGVLWVCVVLNPHCSASERSMWIRKLKSWSELPVCPLEDAYSRPSSAHGWFNSLAVGHKSFVMRYLFGGKVQL